MHVAFSYFHARTLKLFSDGFMPPLGRQIFCSHRASSTSARPENLSNSKHVDVFPPSTLGILPPARVLSNFLVSAAALAICTALCWCNHGRILLRRLAMFIIQLLDLFLFLLFFILWSFFMQGEITTADGRCAKRKLRAALNNETVSSFLWRPIVWHGSRTCE